MFTLLIIFALGAQVSVHTFDTVAESSVPGDPVTLHEAAGTPTRETGDGGVVSAPVTISMFTGAVAIDQNFAQENLKWDAGHGRYLSADGEYTAEPKGLWRPRQWQTVPAQFRTETYKQKVCYGTHCEYVNRTRQVQVAPARTVEVFDREPEVGLSADEQPTPMEGVSAGLRALNLKPSEVLVDYGCGHDARWLITAVRSYGTQRAIGVEIDPEVADSARRYVAHAGLSDNIQIITGDATMVNVKADVGVAYLWPIVLTELRPQIKQLDRFVSFGHEVPGLPMRNSGDLFVYERPQPVVMLPPPRPAGAVWGGRVYSGPVCNRRNCSMCNAIRNQLAWH